MFTVGDIIVLYSDIEIFHVNDNKAPFNAVVRKAAILLMILAVIGWLAVV